MRVGIFGGTFDPIHVGHLIAAEGARTGLSLDEVLFIPAGQPWFKTGRPMAAASHRLAMVRMAVASNPGFQVSDVEIMRPGPSYTVDTLRELGETFGADAGLYVILGFDALAELGRWHQPERVLEMATVVGMRRPGSESFDPQWIEAVSPGASERVVVLDSPLIDVSGVELRRRVAEGRSIKYLVPEPVEGYIREHRLYTSERWTSGSEASPRVGATPPAGKGGVK